MAVVDSIRTGTILLTFAIMNWTLACWLNGTFLPQGMEKVHVMVFGGTVKCGTLRTSPQRSVSEQILTPKDMFEFCSQTMYGIQFHFVSKESVLEVDRLHQIHFNNTHNIKGTRRYHRYIPQSTTSLAVHDFSLGKQKRIVHVTAHLTQEELPDVTVGGYVA